MYTCERCGTRFGRPSAALESCPRCLARDGVRVALAFRVFGDGQSGPSTPSRSGGLETAVRERLAAATRAGPRVAGAALDLAPGSRDAA